MQKSWLKNCLVCGIICLFLGINNVPLIAKNVADDLRLPLKNGNVLYVGGLGPYNYTTIQSAIDAAIDGDIIFVFNGTYCENIIIDKSISVIGEKKETTIIDGRKTIDIVQITKDNVFLSNFTLYNSGSTVNDAGIEIRSNCNIIQNIVFFDVGYGIWVINGKNNIFTNNLITAKWDGIWLFRSGNNVMKNNFLFECGFVLDGQNLTDFLQDIDTTNFANDKPVYYYKNTEDIKIPDDAGQVMLVNCSNCEVSNLKISNVTDCIEIMFSHNNTIRNNVLSNSRDYGIRMFQSNYNIVSDNTCSSNPSAGISFLGILDLGGEDFDIKHATIRGFCKYNILSNNTIVQNTIGILIYTSDNNFIFKNEFKKNTINVFFYNCKNKWKNNYWDRSRLLPKPIFGVKKINEVDILWINFDWHPAKEPYDGP